MSFSSKVPCGEVVSMSAHPNCHYNAIYDLDEYFHFRQRAVIVVWMSTHRNYHNPLGGNGSLDEYSSELPQSR